jgi:cation diffusion facilitator family transporter
MHSRSLDDWTHEHVFLGVGHARNERRSWLVVGLTGTMMVAEIIGGIVFGSMALLADGWHMSTHAAALAVAAFAYRYARHHTHDPRFAFGTGKLGDLAAFASAVVLGIIALLIAYESLIRLTHPVSIAYVEAISIAVVGLAVNLICALLLRDEHTHTHDHAHADDHGHDRAHGHHGHRDHNLRAAYLHVLADAVTSVMAIGGLILALWFGWPWIDAVVGLIGACVIASWSYGLIRDAGRVLLDMVPDGRIQGSIRQRLEVDGDRVADLHLWQIGPGHRAAIVTIVTDRPKAPAAYKERLSGLAGLSHVTIEVEPCLPKRQRSAA